VDGRREGKFVGCLHTLLPPTTVLANAREKQFKWLANKLKNPIQQNNVKVICDYLLLLLAKAKHIHIVDTVLRFASLPV